MFTRFCLLFLMSAGIGFATPYSALRDGEFFRYRAGWGPFPNAGEIRISARYFGPPGNPDTVRLSMVTSTRGMVHAFYRYEDRSEAEIDLATGRIRRITNQSTGGDQPINATATFDYRSRLATYRDSGNSKRDRDIPIPAGDPLDILSALIQTRDWNLRVGDKRDALVFAGRAIYPITIRAEKTESISTLSGRRDTLVLVPRMETQKPFGMFRRGGEIKVWLAQDEHRLPVKLTLNMKFGTATLQLEEHGFLPPTGSAAKLASVPATRASEPTN